MKKNGVVLTTFILFFALFANVSAEITLSEPLDVYNVGDKLHVSATGLRGANSGNLDIDLACKNATINLVRISARAFSTEEDQTYSIPYKILDEKDLAINDLSSILGTCKLAASLGSSSATSKEFTISNETRVTARLDKSSYNPGETITLVIEAIKANGNFLEGFVEITNATNVEKAIVGGSAREVIETADTLEAGSYTLNIRAYDQETNGAQNMGETKISYIINQVPSFIKMSLSHEQATPGEPFSIGVEAFDQSGKSMPGEISVRMISPLEEATELSIGGGEFKEIEFPNDAIAGVWKLMASFDGILDEREFEMKEIQKVAFEFEEDSVLVIRNIGNALYNKTIKVKIGEEERELELRIERGEARRFDLTAPSGEYDVIVGDDENQVSQHMLITGRAISIKDLDSPGVSLLWIFLVIVLIAVAAYFLIKRLRGKGHVSAISEHVGKQVGKVKQSVSNKIPNNIKSRAGESIAFTNKSPEVHSLDTSKSSAEDKSMIDMTRKKAGIAESSPTVKGEKYPSAVLALHVTNYADLNEHAHSELKKIVESASAPKGLIDWREDYIFILFSPLITRTYSNEILAARAGVSIKEAIATYNKKFTNKFEYSIGVHSGDLVASKAGGKVKYTSMGNTISFSKRLADASKGKVLVSEEVRKKLLRDLKVEKEGMVNSKPAYSITEIKDRAQNEAKLKDLLKRM